MYGVLKELNGDLDALGWVVAEGIRLGFGLLASSEQQPQRSDCGPFVQEELR